MKCSVYIATSADGFIARNDGSADWLETCGNPNANVNHDPDYIGFDAFMSTIDCMIMGRKTIEVISTMILPPDKWPYGNTRIIVLSQTLKEPPKEVKQFNVEVHQGEIKDLIAKLDQEGYKHAYIDGSMTIQNFIKLELIDEFIISKAPILLGKGIPLFGNLDKEIELENIFAQAFTNGFIQEKFTLKYSS